MKLIDLTPEGLARDKERAIILERWIREFEEEGRDVLADKADSMLADIESEDLFNETYNRK